MLLAARKLPLYANFICGKLSLDTRENLFNPFICVIVVVKETDDHSVRFCVTGKSICLICVYMHCQTEILVYPDNYIRID